MSTTSPDEAVRRAGGEPKAAPSNTDGAVQRAFARLLGSPLFWGLFFVVAFGWPIVRVARTALPPPLPVLGSVSDFALVEQNGRAFGTADVRGKVWLLSTVQTSSSGAHKIATELGKIQHRTRNLGPAFHIVTVGTDQETDSREHLVEFISHYRVSPRMWSFLSGDTASLRQSVPDGPLSVALVDQKMRVRGRYDLGERDAIDLCLYHAGLLVNRGE